MPDSLLKPLKVLVVDDDEEARFAIESIVLAAEYQVCSASNGKEALQVAEQELPDIIVMDVNMPIMDGFEAALNFKSDPVLRFSPVILLTSRDDLDDIVHGLKQGADDYLSKPYRKEELLARLQAALRSRAVYKELWQRQEEIENSKNVSFEGSFGPLIGESKVMQEIYNLIDRVKDADAPVLIMGESGTGKELVARSLHEQSCRSDKPFVVQNCAALNEQLLESELFGHVKGAFTGAVKTKPGLFEVADGGTFFLDELGEMSQALQVKLLRVLQDGTFLPVGGTEMKRSDVRVVAATNRNIPEMVKEGEFREDLYYRLNVVTIELPPLRERLSDVKFLVDHFLSLISKRTNQSKKNMEPDVLRFLQTYSWPGNIRELQNEVERVCILSGKQNTIAVSDLSSRIVGSSESKNGSFNMEGSLKDAVENLENQMIKAALERCNGNKSEAARELGISRSNLINKVKQFQ